MKLRQSLFVLLNAGFASGSVQAQAKWDLHTPYPEGNFHTKTVKQLAEVLLNK